MLRQSRMYSPSDLEPLALDPRLLHGSAGMVKELSSKCLEVFLMVMLWLLLCPRLPFVAFRMTIALENLQLYACKWAL